MNTWVKGAMVIFLVAGTAIPVRAAANDETAALKKQVAELNAKVMELEHKLAQPDNPVATVQAQAARPSPVAHYTWDPFAEMDAMERQMQGMMGHSFGPSARSGFPASPVMRIQMNAFNPGYDLKETDKNYLVTFDMPGMDKAKINVEVKDGALYVSGERSSEEKENKGDRFYRQERNFGYFSRVIPLPENAKADSVQAKYDNGVLTVTIDKKESAPKPKDNAQKIEVK